MSGAEADAEGSHAREAQQHLLQQSPPSSSSSANPNPTSSSAAGAGHAQNTGIHIAAPSSYLRPVRPMTPQPPSLVDSDDPIDREQLEGLRAIRAFLKLLACQEKLKYLDPKRWDSQEALSQLNLAELTIRLGIVSAPLWDSKTSTFAGLLTTSDYINVIQYYWQNPDTLAQVDQFRLNGLREVEKAIGAAPIETVSIHPEKPLYDACRKMLHSRARRIPLIDIDDETERPMVVSVVTQYRILKFIAVNVNGTQMLRKPLKDLKKVGTFKDLCTAYMDSPVIDVIHMLVRKNISSVPILDRENSTVINVFEAVDVISVIKGGNYDDLNLSVGEALLKRSDEFAGIYTCSIHDNLATILDTVRRSRVHRFVVIDEQNKLEGVLTLSDILQYILLEAANEDEE